MSKKIKIAFIKYGGLTVGGSEKLLQIIAAFLPKDKFEVDFYACDSGKVLGPKVNIMATSEERISFLKTNGVNIKKFKVEARDLRTYSHKWVNTNFWEIFHEKDYDLIQTCRAGHKEYPFTKIHHTPIIDIIALSSGVDNQYNISRVMHLNQWSTDNWIKRGGDPSRVVFISLPIWVPKKDFGDFRQKLNLEDKFIFGFHQRPENNIFSSIPLAAYKKIATEKTAFLMLGGGDAYKKQANDLKLKNVYFLEPTADQEVIYKFLNTLNVFAHGRKDGEVNSQAMAEAMYFGLPIVSHISQINNGHIECIGEAGRVVETEEQYAEELRRLMADKAYFLQKHNLAKERFANHYELHGQIENIVRVYEAVVKNPYPNFLKRVFYSLHYTQNVRIWLAQMYLFLKYYLGFTWLGRG